MRHSARRVVSDSSLLTLCSGPPREAQLIYPIKLTSSGDLDLARNTKVMAGNRLSLLSGIDPNTNNVSPIYYPCSYARSKAELENTRADLPLLSSLWPGYSIRPRQAKSAFSEGSSPTRTPSCVASLSGVQTSMYRQRYCVWRASHSMRIWRRRRGGEELWRWHAADVIVTKKVPAV